MKKSVLVHNLFKLIFLAVIFIPGNFTYAYTEYNILFIGNSYTYFNDMPKMFHEFAVESNIEVYIDGYLAGGYDIANQATTDDSLFAKICSKKWDYIIIQDNQGRLVGYSFKQTPETLPAYSILNDYIKENNTCAKIIWFAGWAGKGGIPQFIPGDTEEKCINRIFDNSKYVNEKIFDGIVCPIGKAWLKVMKEFPEINLYGNDNSHPSLAGSYIAASALFTSIFKTDISYFKYVGGLDSTIAKKLRTIAFHTVLDSALKKKCNLDAFTPEIEIEGDKISLSNRYRTYQWYKNGKVIADAVKRSYIINSEGYYFAIVVNSNGCRFQTIPYYKTQKP